MYAYRNDVENIRIGCVEFAFILFANIYIYIHHLVSQFNDDYLNIASNDYFLSVLLSFRIAVMNVKHRGGGMSINIIIINIEWARSFITIP